MAALRMTGRTLFVLMALHAWSASAGRLGSARTLAQLPQPSAADCQFTEVVSQFLQGFVMVTPEAATKCFNAIQIDYDLAAESVRALADIFERTYAFVAIAADPAGTKESNPYKFKVFDQKVNIPKELRDLADSFPKDEPVPLGDLAFPMNELFNRLRDAHVSYSGGGTVFGGVIPTMAGDNAGGASRVYLVDEKTTAPMLDISIKPDADGNPQIFFAFLNRQNRLVAMPVTAIDGKDPMDTLIKWADNPAFPWESKALGTRINEMLRPGMFNNLRLETIGRLSGLENVKVEFGDGTTSTLVWAVSMSNDLTDADLAAYQKKANTLGVPIKALITFLNVYINETAERAPPATSGPPPIKVIADKSETAIAPGVTITPISNYGFYFFSGTKAILKLNHFLFSPEQLAQWWPVFIAAAKRQRATNLILDLTNNGGGTISTGLGLVLGLYPDSRVGDFGLTYDRIIGPDASYAYNNSLQPKSLQKFYKAFVSNNAALQARVNAINNNATEMDRLQRLTIGSFKAISALFSASSAQTQACTASNGTRIDCADLWNSLTSKLQASLQSVFNGAISAARLATLLTKDLQALLDAFWPYSGTEYGISGGVDQYEKPVNYVRGGETRSYTGKFSFADDTETFRDYFGSSVGPQPPFQNIVAVANGFCGSTCDTFSMSAWFYSKENPSQPKFKWATFGGTGKREDSSCTSFPGGNVNNDDLLTQTWAYEAVAYLQSEWAGDNNKSEIVATLVDYLPLFPGFLDTRTPGYTQSEIYRKPMGPNSLPMEFYLIPPDYQINAWYRATQLPKPGTGLTADLLSLYNEAEKLLDQL